MISMPLLKRNLFSSFKVALIILAIILMYTIIIIYMFDPKLADMLNDYQAAMPEMMSAVGMTGAATTLTEFVNTYLYGFIMTLIPAIFTIIIVNKLVMQYVDSGSMACILATPNSRAKIICTQLLSVLIGIVFIIGVTVISGIITSEVLFKGELDIDVYLRLNFSVFLLQFALGGISFFAACYFNESKGYFTVGAGLPFLFYIIKMMANMGGDLEKFKYATIFSLFPANEIVNNQKVVGYNVAMLVIGVVLYTSGCVYFTKKDLSI